VRGPHIALKISLRLFTRLARQQAQAGLHRLLLGGEGACMHGLGQQLVVNIDVGTHDVH